MKKYDIIGDVHGYATSLINLLEKMGYKKTGKTYHHKDRKVIFVGDYIDRGIEEESSCMIVKSMVESGDAFATLGNHEYNAICYATMGVDGEYLREHNSNNTRQHSAFLKEFPFGSSKHKEIINWFKTLPVFLEIDGIRIVHATWDQPSIDFLKSKLSNNLLTDDFLHKSAIKNTSEYNAIETVLKGIELILKDNLFLTDKDGIERNTMRFNWFTMREKITYVNSALSFPDVSILTNKLIEDAPSLYKDEIPVFFGHYWMSGVPMVQTPYTACVDYSVAKGGSLVAYRWDGELILSNDKFIYCD
jgi:hypothetical protein